MSSKNSAERFELRENTVKIAKMNKYCYIVSTEKLICPPYLSKLGHFFAQCLRLRIEKRKTEQILAKLSLKNWNVNYVFLGNTILLPNV